MMSATQRLSLLEAIVEQSFDAILITDANLKEGGPFIVYANPQFCEMTGYAASALIGQSPRILQGKGTDPAVIEQMRQSVQQGKRFEGHTVNYRIDQTPYTVQWKISPVRDETGVITHYFSVQKDITLRLLAEEKQNLLAKALNVALDPIFITDAASNIIFINESFLTLTGYSAHELIGKTPRTFSSGKHDALFYSNFDSLLKIGKPFRTAFINKRKNGSLFHAELGISPIFNLNKEITHYISTTQDITSRLNREQRLIKIAHSDPLTGLYNRRAAETELKRKISRSTLSGKTFSLIVCDVDHFKNVNDNYGHTVGDEVLKRIAEIFIYRIRNQDIAARWGGEEFVIITQDSSLAQGLELAERIRSDVEHLTFEKNQRITVSLGVAEFSPGQTTESLFNNADEALYQAKKSGRNRVEMARSTKPTE